MMHVEREDQRTIEAHGKTLGHIGCVSTVGQFCFLRTEGGEGSPVFVRVEVLTENPE